MKDLDSYKRAEELRAKIKGKEGLYKLYQEFYRRYAETVQKSPSSGIIIEIGSGAGFIKEIVSEVITTDILLYETIELAMDATKLPFPDNSIKSVFMLNTLHHIPDAETFFKEISRCLKPGGRVLIIDQYHGWLSKIILKYFHHENYDPKAKRWGFETSGPLSGANGALSWIVFYRDRSLFENLYPSLSIATLKPHTPLRYWLSGGLKSWNLLPGSLFNLATKLDNWLCTNFPKSSSFIDIEIIKS